MKDFLLDLRRACLLVVVGIRYGATPVLRWILHRPVDASEVGACLRAAFEELGLTYIKAGQYLAMRYDVLPGEICRELDKLFENVSPISFDQVVTVIEAELGGPIDRHFSSVNPEPIGSASVAQVHEACTASGERVAVKIQRPGIRRTFAADIRNLRRLARFVDRLGVLGSLSSLEMVDQFAGWTGRELDFVIEGHTADRLRSEALSHEVVPEVFWDLTTSRLLTLEFVEGVSLSRIAHLMDEGGIAEIRALVPHLDLEQALHHLAASSLNQLFVYGFFHGDPHPGNLLVLEDNRLAFVDFGIFGVVADYQRDVVAGLLRNISFGNIPETFRYFARMFAPTAETDLRTFQRESHAGLREWYDASINPNSPMLDRHLGKYIGRMLSIARRNHLRMETHYLLFWRVLNSLDSTVLRLSPEFDIIAEIRGFFERMEPNPIQRALNFAVDANRQATVVQLAHDLPRYARQVLHDVHAGVAEWQVTAEEPSREHRDNSRRAARLAAGLLVLSVSLLVSGVAMPGPLGLALCVGLLVLSGAAIWPQ